MLQHPLGLGAEALGAWSGASVHEVAQMVATAADAGPVALTLATVVKLTRAHLEVGSHPVEAGSSGWWR